jgi:hypothetical protein
MGTPFGGRMRGSKLPFVLTAKVLVMTALTFLVERKQEKQTFFLPARMWSSEAPVTSSGRRAGIAADERGALNTKCGSIALVPIRYLAT